MRMIPSRSLSETLVTVAPLFTVESWWCVRYCVSAAQVSVLSFTNVPRRLTVCGPLSFGLTNAIPFAKSRRYTPWLHPPVPGAPWLDGSAGGDEVADPRFASNSSNHSTPWYCLLLSVKL